ncbi:helix-turn-helix transcriptional regulator [Desulfotignum phosphitoxidans]|uniref:Transcriptional regulator-like protein, WYL-domain containing n=1 Tax=Desulfotignum phosphitoxidans DSM 13687 TaxID=1286635 RepID=S0FTK6_9BACT|nr:WYL domain-containing protein [Desulfotignum phosphitoxidans]EMS78428.1 transcriptional regulator-like protein, WYL-domain containing [Desulfotignum phosphitoxidans DSM 13687]
MPRKIQVDKDHGQKVIELFFKLFFSPYEYSLTELARELECSKQTIGRIVDKINYSLEGIKIEDFIKNRKRYFKIDKKNVPVKAMNLSQSEYGMLQMCCSFTRHLMGKETFDQAVSALGKSQVLIKDKKTISPKHFASFVPGTIDYSGHQQIIKDLIIAMENQKVCKISYQSVGNINPKNFYLKPLKLFSRDDTIYLHAQMAKDPGKMYKTPKFDPLLAVHRMEDLKITTTSFEYPENFSFEEAFNQTFGVMKEDLFQIRVEFEGYAAMHVKERIWSTDQTIKEIKDGRIELIFTASSYIETLSWILSYGHEAKVIEPDWFVEEIHSELKKMHDLY